MLREFEQRDGRPLVLHRNGHNEGIDGNIDRVGKLAFGRFILFMSDDDVLLPGTLRRLQAMTRENAPRLAFSALALNVVKRRTCAIRCRTWSSLFAWGANPPLLDLEGVRSVAALHVVGAHRLGPHGAADTAAQVRP